jgi:flagellar motor component MotA
MKTFFHFVVFMIIAVVAIVIGVIIGDYGSWYFAWLVGTVMIVLVAAGAGALFDTQEDERNAAP